MALERVKGFFGKRWALEERAINPISFDEFASYFTYNGTAYPLSFQQTMVGNQERPTGDFTGLVEMAYKSNGIIFACITARQMLFQEARFQFRTLEKGRPGKFFGHPSLTRLEHPWPGGTTGDLLARAMQDADLGGNFFATRTVDGIQRLRPDWVTIIAGSPDRDASAWDIGARVLGYLYTPGGPNSGRDPIALLREQVCHYAPHPDPISPWRGISWLRPVITDLGADNAATEHKAKFFENGATPNLVIKFDPTVVDSMEKFEAWADKIEEKHTGYMNAYRTLFLGGATDASVIGTDMRQMDFKATQGAGETRIAVVAGVPAAILGISEGLQGSSLNAGNYDAAFQRFADLTIRPLWRNFCGSMETLVPPPQSNSQLWYDDRDIPALRQDEHERAEIQKLQAEAISSLFMAGFAADSVVDAVATGELSKLKHEGRPSVQVQPVADPQSNGKATPALPAPAET